MENNSQDEPMARKWIYGLKEECFQMSVRLLRFSLYPDLLPEKALPEYINVVLKILEDPQKNLINTLGEKVRQSLLILLNRQDSQEEPPDPVLQIKIDRIREILANAV